VTGYTPYYKGSTPPLLPVSPSSNRNIMKNPFWTQYLHKARKEHKCTKTLNTQAAQPSTHTMSHHQQLTHHVTSPTLNTQAAQPSTHTTSHHQQLTHHVTSPTLNTQAAQPSTHTKSHHQHSTHRQHNPVHTPRHITNS